MTSKEWMKHADAFLKDPPRKSPFGKKGSPNENGGLAVVSRSRTDEGTSRDRVLRAIFASFVDLFCESMPADKREHVRTELCATLADLHLIPNFYFSQEFSPLRRSFSSVISHTLANVFNPSAPHGTKLLSPPTVPFFSSRYRSDFEEQELLGEGGFGTVHKVKCLIDNQLYAVKKIKLRKNLTDFSLKVLNEIQVLASLQHQNVVRYHCGWIEMLSEASPFAETVTEKVPFTPVKITEITDDEENVFVDKKPAQPAQQDAEAESAIEGSSATSDDDGSFASTSSDDEEKQPQTGGKFWNCGDSTSDGDTQAVTEITQNGYSTATEEPEPNNQKPVTTLGMWQPVVYIQMELCTNSLEDYLQKRNEERAFLGTLLVDGAFNRDLCVQLLSAVEYIHNSHLIHRDIKPANIFLKPNGSRTRFLLGDFGLACEDVDAVVDGKSAIKKRRRRHTSSHSVGVGTTAYAAPEQLQSSEYGSAVDIYSTGVVIFESYNVFSTSMERLKAIEQLRAKRQITPSMEELWPSVAEIVLKMTDPDPSKRPTASQLLQNFKGDAGSSVAAYREIIRAKDKEINALRAEVAKWKLAAQNNL